MKLHITLLCLFVVALGISHHTQSTYVNEAAQASLWIAPKAGPRCVITPSGAVMDGDGNTIAQVHQDGRVTGDPAKALRLLVNAINSANRPFPKPTQPANSGVNSPGRACAM